jgi:hypothetical protein
MALFPLGILSAAGAGGAVAGDYELITSTILGSAQSSVVFDVSSYAATYKHLQIRATMRVNSSDPFGYMGIRFNGDTGSNYNEHYLFNQQPSSVVSGNTASTSIFGGQIAGNTSAANSFGAVVVDILDFASTTKNTTLRLLSGQVSPDNTSIRFASGLFRNTAAITSITYFERAFSSSLVAGSRFSLYGIRG